VQYEDDVVLSDETITVRDRIGAAADGSGAADETYVSLTVGVGTNIEKHISYALSSLEVPMTDAPLERKFIDQCLPIWGSSGVQQASKSRWELEESSDEADCREHMKHRCGFRPECAVAIF